MEISIDDFIPDHFLTYEEFNQLESLINKQKTEGIPTTCVSFPLGPKVFDKIPYHPQFKMSYLNMCPPSEWSYTTIKEIKKVLYNIYPEFFPNPTTYQSTLYKQPYELVRDLQCNTKTIHGTLKDKLQSGHSMFLNLMHSSEQLNRTRGIIFADSRNDNDTISMSKSMLASYLNYYDDKLCENSFIEIPETIALYIKRDPVIWTGSIMAIFYIRIINEDSTIGVSPILFEALNMDVDGDTVVLYAVENTFTKKDQRQTMSKPTLFGYSGNRWKYGTSHIMALMIELLRHSGYDIEELMKLTIESNKPINKIEDFPFYPIYKKCILEDDHNDFFGPIMSKIFNSCKHKFFLVDILIVLQICDFHRTFSNFIINLLHTKPSTGLYNFTSNSCLYLNLLYLTGIEREFKNFNSFINGFKLFKNPDDSLFLKINKDRQEELEKYSKNVQSTMTNLPRESFIIQLLHTNASMVNYCCDEIRITDKVLAKNVSKHIPLECFLYKYLFIPNMDNIINMIHE
jgi:hypothetical protein